MTDTARVRISRVTMKAGGASLSMIPTRPAPDDTNFVPTLVWVLEQARLGKVVGYAMVVSVEHEAEDGPSRRCIEAAMAWDETDRHHVLGLIRRMEINYMKRTWPDEDE